MDESDPIRIMVTARGKVWSEIICFALERDGFLAKRIEFPNSKWRKDIPAWEPHLLILAACAGQAILDICQFTQDVLPATQKLILLSGDGKNAEEKGVLVSCVEAGARGFKTEESSYADLVESIRQLMTGNYQCDGSIFDALMASVADATRDDRRRKLFTMPRLTARERQILWLISDGKSNKQIAKKLNISLYTVKNHVHNLLEKLAVPDRMRAIDLATSQGMLRGGFDEQGNSAKAVSRRDNGDAGC